MEYYFRKVQKFFGKGNCSLDIRAIIFKSDEFNNFDNFLTKFKQFLISESCPYKQFDILVNYDIESSIDDATFTRCKSMIDIFVDTVKQLDFTIGCTCHDIKKINYIEVDFHNSYDFDC
jgi:hypothetical protein